MNIELIHYLAENMKQLVHLFLLYSNSSAVWKQNIEIDLGVFLSTIHKKMHLFTKSNRAKRKINPLSIV